MKKHARKMLALALVIIIGIICIGAALYGMRGHNNASKLYSKTESNQLENSSKYGTTEGIDELSAQVKRLKREITELKTSSDKMNLKVRKQEQKLNDVNASADLGASNTQPSEEKEAHPELTPEEEIELAEAQLQSQIELMEKTIFTEETDPEWSSEAELALDEAYRSGEMEMVEIVDIDCRTTLCRVELSFDGSGSSEEDFFELVGLIPWGGQRFMRVDTGENAEAVVYLAREGHSLPRYIE